jgi:hypothetical protein
MKALNEHARRVVAAHHCSASDADEDGNVAILDEEGDWIVCVPHDIPPDMMRLVFKHGARMYQTGRKVGAAETQATVRRALGIEG